MSKKQTSKDNKEVLQDTLVTVLTNYVELSEAATEYYTASQDSIERLEDELRQSEHRVSVLEERVRVCDSQLCERERNIEALDFQLFNVKQSRDLWASWYVSAVNRAEDERQKSLWQHVKDACRRAWEPA
jgi:septal ring factor EnvC (AmiA/AmiB activator)